jgi:hypothetical protein
MVGKPSPRPQLYLSIKQGSTFYLSKASSACLTQELNGVNPLAHLSKGLCETHLEGTLTITLTAAHQLSSSPLGWVQDLIPEEAAVYHQLFFLVRSCA